MYNLLVLVLQLYDTLRQEDPDVLKKIVPISGDITLPYLGISEEDQETLASEVSVVIHSAATVKFDEKLKLSINVNVQGTKRIVELCKRMKKLAVSNLQAQIILMISYKDICHYICNGMPKMILKTRVQSLIICMTGACPRVHSICKL